MNLEKISPIIEKIIKDVLLERRYPYGWTKFGVSNKNASGNLIDYISVRTESSKNQSTLELYMLYYADVVDKGRRKGEYVSPMAIMEWIKNKGINVRDEKGRFEAGARTVSGSVKYFIEMLIEAEASLKKTKSKESIAVAADFLTNLDEDGEDAGQVLEYNFWKPQSNP